MATTTLLSFWAFSLLLIVTPGPDWAFLLGQVLRGRGMVAPLVGITLGYLGLTTVVAAGVGTLVSSQPAVLAAITVLGAVVLVKIGWSMLSAAWRGPVALEAEGPAPDGEPAPLPAGGGGAVALATVAPPTRPEAWRLVLQGTAVSGLNPKGLMLFIAMLPQFVSVSAPWPAAAQLFTLGLVFVVSAVTFYAGLGIFARKALAGSERATRVLTGAAGAAMLLLAVGMLGQQLPGF